MSADRLEGFPVQRNALKGRRAAVLPVTGELLRTILLDGLPCGVRVVKESLPSDARIVGADWDSIRGEILLVLESQSFELVAEGGTPPRVSGPQFSDIMPPNLEPSPN